MYDKISEKNRREHFDIFPNSSRMRLASKSSFPSASFGTDIITDYNTKNATTCY